MAKPYKPGYGGRFRPKVKIVSESCLLAWYYLSSQLQMG